MKCFKCGAFAGEGEGNTLCYNCEAINRQNMDKAYQAMIKDPNFCGLEPIVTGPNDPFYQSGACPTHDISMTEGKPALATAARFAYDSMNTAVINTAKAIYSVGFVIPYIIVGSIGGYFRDILKNKDKRD